ncbi:MAG: helix-turn-helix domain-containing protein [Chloroflexota bacterium]|nr:helix-turn-helix domain-containing protein [Chloroflexota bacterium]
MSQAQPSIQPTQYTVQQAAQLLNYSVAHVWRLVYSGELPVVRSGRLVRIRREHIERWQHEHEVRGGDSGVAWNA